MLGHCLAISDVPKVTFLEKAFHVFFTGGTFYFVLISGILFHHVFYKDFKLKNFLVKKTKYVVFPYLIMSLLPIIYLVCISDFSSKYPESYFSSNGEGFWNIYILPSIKYLLSGDHMTAYWYIPFIFIIFLLSPLFVFFIKTKPATKFFIILLLTLNSSVIHRPEDNLYFSIVQSVIYFLPIYMIGIMFSENRVKITNFLENKLFIPLLLSLVFLLLHVRFGSELDKNSFIYTYEGIDFSIGHKLFFGLFIILFFTKLQTKNINRLKLISASSFGIYFIHGPVLKVLNKAKNHLDLNFDNYVFSFFFISLFVFFSSYFLSYLAKLFFKKKSRYIIGS